METIDDLKRLEDHLRRDIPSLKVAWKDKSWYHQILGLLLHPFNPDYLSKYTTTIGSTVYFPSQASYESLPHNSMVVLAHEFVHIHDSQRNPFFKLAYLFPQILCVVPIVLFSVLAGSNAWIPVILLLGYLASAVLSKAGHRNLGLGVLAASVVLFLVLGVLLTKWLTLILLGVLVAGPWPAPWRTEYELRGYGMTIAYQVWRNGSVSDPYVESLVKLFVGPPYFFMSWNKGYVQRSLEATRQQAGQKALNSIRPYSVVHEYLSTNGRIRGQ